MKSHEILSLAELKAWAAEFSKSLSGDEILFLSGPLGSGKTQFIKYLLENFGIQEVSSPTFNIHQRYEGRLKVDHFDLYRVKSDEELEGLLLDEILAGKSLVFVEWPERLMKFHFSRKVIRIQFFMGENEGSRWIEVSR